jgi:hypothetical protein
MMANLSFLSALNEEQRQFAEIIRRRAREMGVPEDLAVAVAYQESRLNPAPKDSRMGAVGIMQVMPATGKGMGVGERELRDPMRNIDAGLMYLKQALRETQDPALAVIYYNAGPGGLRRFDQGGDLPKETQNYLLALKGYGAFRPSEPPAEPQLNQPEPPSEPGLNRSEPSEPDPYQLPDLSAIEAEQERRLAQIYGAGAGLGASGLRLASTGAKAGAQAMGQSLGQGLVQGQSMTAPPTGGGMPTPMGGPQGGPQGRPMVGPVGGPAGPVGGPAAPGSLAPGGTRPPPFASQPGAAGAFPRAAGPGQGVVNTGRAFGLTPIEAAQATGMTKQEGGVWDLINKAQEGRGRVAQMGGGYVENPMFGGIMTPDQGAGRGPRASYVSTGGGLQAIPTPSPVPTTPPKLGPLEQVGQQFKQMARSGLAAAQPLASLAMRYIAPPLAGAEAGRQFTGMMQDIEAEEPDYVRAALRGLGGTASLASMVPPLAPFALPVAAGAPMVEEMRERIRSQPAVPDEPLSPAEAQMYSRPSFRMPAMRSSAQPRR